MRVPGSAKAQVWVGLLVAFVGVLVGGYAYTGDRAYEIWAVGLAFAGFMLVVLGSLLTAWGQANKPRLATKKSDANQAQAPTPTPRPATRRKGAAFTLACASCGHVFAARGKAPFDAVCPSCGHEGRVERPPDPAAEAADGSHGAMAPPVRGAVQVQLACATCEHVFTARGKPPFEAACPSCGAAGKVPVVQAFD